MALGASRLNANEPADSQCPPELSGVVVGSAVESSGADARGEPVSLGVAVEVDATHPASNTIVAPSSVNARNRGVRIRLLLPAVFRGSVGVRAQVRESPSEVIETGPAR